MEFFQFFGGLLRLTSGNQAYAIADKKRETANPMDATKAGGVRKGKRDPKTMTDREKKIRESNEHAYTLEEVVEMLDKLPEPARTVCAAAAFTGLTRSELRGLKWSDYDGKTIKVQRKVWHDYTGATKTEAREAGVEVIPVLRKILAKYKAEFPPVGEGWIFRGEKLHKPLDLDNLSRRDIPQFVSWFGWHAFRRGLGTRLYEMGFRDIDIQQILRHADVATTKAFYIKPSEESTRATMKQRFRSRVARGRGCT